MRCAINIIQFRGTLVRFKQKGWHGQQDCKLCKEDGEGGRMERKKIRWRVSEKWRKGGRVEIDQLGKNLGRQAHVLLRHLFKLGWNLVWAERAEFREREDGGRRKEQAFRMGKGSP